MYAINAPDLGVQTSPVWIASPPEVHSTLLSTGAGPGPLLAAAAAWTLLSTHYTAAAEELAALVETVRGGAWQGQSAEQYVMAHLPYLSWLSQAGADSAAAAARHETVAAAYGTALAAMPTLAELAANHTTHAALLATNFFGINTVPIAVNEADYARIWIQAAATMEAYQNVSETTLTATPDSAPAPAVLKSDAAAANPPSSPFNFYSLPTQLLHVFQNPAGVLRQMQAAFAASPLVALTTWGPLLFVIGYNVIPWPLPIYLGTTTAGVLPIAVGAGMNLLLAAAAPQTALPAFTPGPTPGIPLAPAAGLEVAPSVVTHVASTGVTTPAAGGSVAAPPTPLTADAASVGGYLVAGLGPGRPESDPPFTGHGEAKAPTDPAPDATSATAITAQRNRVRRRKRLGLRDHGNEYANLNQDPEAPPAERPDATTASDRGVEPLGFTGALPSVDNRRAAGLTTLTSDEFGGAPTVPMMPATSPGTLVANR